VSFAAITLRVASQRVFIVYFVITQSGNFWTRPTIKEMVKLSLCFFLN
jgi:hypothetical protein